LVGIEPGERRYGKWTDMMTSIMGDFTVPAILGCVRYISPTTQTYHNTEFIILVRDSRHLREGRPDPLATPPEIDVPKDNIRLFVWNDNAG